MIVEQIRYFASDDSMEHMLVVRRSISRLRAELNIPEGHILVADEGVEEGPRLIWQCIYRDEGQLASAEGLLMGNAKYEEARSLLGQLASRIELELYIGDEPEGEAGAGGSEED